MEGPGKEWNGRHDEAVTNGNKKTNCRKDEYFLRQLVLIDFN
jgi:hypothetical protein